MGVGEREDGEEAQNGMHLWCWNRSLEQWISVGTLLAGGVGLKVRIESRAALDLYARPGSCSDHSPNTPFALKHKHDEVASGHSSVGIALNTSLKSFAWTKVMITKPTC